MLAQTLIRSSRALPPAPALQCVDLLESCRSKTSVGAGSPSPDQPFGETAGVRLLDDPDCAAGYMEVASFGERFLVTIHNRRFINAFASRAKLEGHVSMHFRLAGQSTHLFDGIGEMLRRSRSCLLVTYPSGVQNGEWFAPNTVLQSVGLVVAPELLAEEFTGADDHLPAALSRWLAGKHDEFCSLELPFTFAMQRAVAELIATPYRGGIRYRFVEAKALELTCLVAQRLLAPHEPQRPLRLSARERARLYELRELLLREFHAPPTIAELARIAAMNRTKLQEGFRGLFDSSIFEFCNELRMQHAQALLRAGGLSVAEIAYRVGYRHPNNFTAAYRRRFGFLPREDRPHLTG